MNAKDKAYGTGAPSELGQRRCPSVILGCWAFLSAFVATWEYLVVEAGDVEPENIGIQGDQSEAYIPLTLNFQVATPQVAGLRVWDIALSFVSFCVPAASFRPVFLLHHFPRRRGGSDPLPWKFSVFSRITHHGSCPVFFFFSSIRPP